jgi:hypothetical protein
MQVQTTLHTKHPQTNSDRLLGDPWDINWKPMHVLTFVSSSVGGTLKPAGLDKSVGIVSVGIRAMTAA